VSATGRLEAFADAAALVRAACEHDSEARSSILAGADTEAVCEALARVLHRVLLTVGGECENCVTSFVCDWQADIRRALAVITGE
jgi:hypothetical protein